MRKLLPLITAFALVACQDKQPGVTGPMTPPTGVRLSAALSNAESDEWFMRADVVDVNAAVEELAAKVAGVVAITASSSGGNVECDGVLIGTFDNVTVPENANCVIMNSVIRNNVHVKTNGRMFGFTIEVGNNVVGVDVRSVQTFNSTIGNNYHVDRAGELPFYSGQLFNTTVNGNARMREHDPAQVQVFGSRIGKNLDILDNVGRSFFRLNIFNNTVGHQADVSRNIGTGSANVQLNTVADRLRCLDNDPPFIGGPNFAGETVGQCF